MTDQFAWGTNRAVSYESLKCSHYKTLFRIASCQIRNGIRTYPCLVLIENTMKWPPGRDSVVCVSLWCTFDLWYSNLCLFLDTARAALIGVITLLINGSCGCVILVCFDWVIKKLYQNKIPKKFSCVGRQSPSVSDTDTDSDTQ